MKMNEGGESVSNYNYKGLGKSIFEFLTCIDSPKNVLDKKNISRSILFKMQKDIMPERKTTCSDIVEKNYGEVVEFDDESKLANLISNFKKATHYKKEMFNVLNSASVIKLIENGGGLKQTMISKLSDKDCNVEKVVKKKKLVLETYYSRSEENPNWYTLYIYFPKIYSDAIGFQNPMIFDWSSEVDIEKLDLEGDADIVWHVKTNLEMASKDELRDFLIDLICNDSENVDWGEFMVI